jgi:glycine hydroxymethyltransferase
MTDPFAALAATDPEIAEIVRREVERQNTTIQLIASENFTSLAVLAAQGSVLTNKYSEGYPGKRYYGGNYVVDDAEELARDRACALFGTDHANVQPHSGASANMAAYMAVLQLGDKVMGMRLDQGGHLTHGSPVNFSGRLYDFVAYGVDDETETLDYDRIRDLAVRERPKMIVAGATAYPRIIDFAAFRQIADDVGALFMVDMAHFAGLVAGGVHPSPLPFADVVTTTTHKTLRGPRGGMILSRDQAIGKKINAAVFPGLQGGPLMHVIAAKAVAFGEALRPEFKIYARNVVENAKALAEVLKNSGLDIVTGGTDTHLMLVDLRPKGAKGRPAEHALDRAGITCNKNAVPFDTEKAVVTSGVRLGSPAGTTRGFGTAEFREIGKLIVEVVDAVAKNEAGDAQVEQSVARRVGELCNRFPIYP